MKLLPLVVIAVGVGTSALACSSGDSPATVAPPPAASTTQPSAEPEVDDAGATVDAPPAKPAFAPSFPHVENAGGPVIKTPRIVPIVFKDDPLAAEIGKFVGALEKSSFIPDVGKEYGVGAVTAGATITVQTAPATSLTSDEIETWLKTKLSGTTPEFGAPDSNTLYAIFYPAGVNISMGQGVMGQSCQGYGGYHGEVDVGGKPVGYAVLPRCQDIDYLTLSASHEIFEWATDPFPMTQPGYAVVDAEHWAWQASMYGELGDLCTFLDLETIKPADLGYSVQRMFSNAASVAGKFPCMPGGESHAYFQAIPHADDKVDAFDYRSRESLQFVKANAVKLKRGETRTIDVNVWANEPTQDIQLTALTLEEAYQQPSTNGFKVALSKRLANSGDVVQMDITAPARLSSDIVFLYSKKGDRYFLWSLAITTEDQMFPPGSTMGTITRHIPKMKAWASPRERAALARAAFAR